MKQLHELAFNNSFYQLGDSFYAKVKPQGISSPYLVSASHDAAKLIDLNPESFTSSEFLSTFSANSFLKGSQPLAMIYSGHQFGYYNPQLGDGRAALLGEVDGWDINLKGAGETPFSRFADGRAVLRSSIREYLCSEAMAGLGIPTTRALCIIGGKDEIMRETIEPSAIVTRMSQSHIRFGSFEYFFHTQQHEALNALFNYVIKRNYPQLLEKYSDEKERLQQLLIEICQRTAKMVAHWQAVGFAHGVLNTDNMSIIGETFDYGPFGFLDDYNPDFICNHSDHEGRYSFIKQPRIGLWNCSALAHTFSSLLSVDEIKEALGHYEPAFAQHYAQLMRKKLGLRSEKDIDQALCTDLLQLMGQDQVDYSILFRQLSHHQPSSPDNKTRDLFIQREAFDAWEQRYQQRLESEYSISHERQTLMLVNNPKYILRNHLAETAIKKAQFENDFSEVNTLHELLRKPFDEQPEHNSYAGLPPDWGKKISISCSS